MKKEIKTIKDIRLLVDSFYGKVRKDELIGPIFNNVIGDKWPQHLEKMYLFWQTVLLEEFSYSGKPFLPHAKLNITDIHFNRWLDLFHQTLDSLFEGKTSEKAKQQAKSMSKIFNSKINFIRRNK